MEWEKAVFEHDFPPGCSRWMRGRLKQFLQWWWAYVESLCKCILVDINVGLTVTAKQPIYYFGRGTLLRSNPGEKPERKWNRRLQEDWVHIQFRVLIYYEVSQRPSVRPSVRRGRKLDVGNSVLSPREGQSRGALRADHRPLLIFQQI